MALNNTLRPTPLVSKPTVGDAATPTPTSADAASSAASDADTLSAAALATASADTSNPIGTGTAKLLNGDTQEQDNALQKLKYDAWEVTLAQKQLTTLKASGGSDTEVKAAEAELATARTQYETNLSSSASSLALSSARINRYLTGGAHPVPDSALIPSKTDDVTDFIKQMTDALTTATGSDTGTAETGTDGASGTTPTTTPAAGSGTTGVVQNIDKTLTADQQSFLANSGVSLSTTSVAGVTSGDMTANFTLYPTGKPAMNDINQQRSTDCYWLSALTSMAATDKGRDTLQKAISGPASNGDYTVKMYAPSGEPVDIAVNPNNMPMTSDGKPAFNTGADGDTSINWVNLMEAAYAKYNQVYDTNTNSQATGAKGYDGIMQNGVDDTSFNTALTGQVSTAAEITGKDPNLVSQSITQGLASGQPVEAYNYDSDATTVSEKGINIVPKHSYGVVGISADGQTVTLRNPWGRNYSDETKGQNADGTFTMDINEFTKIFEQINA